MPDKKQLNKTENKENKPWRANKSQPLGSDGNHFLMAGHEMAIPEYGHAWIPDDKRKGTACE